MQWIKPDFEEISLGMEATAYVNIEGASPFGAEGPAPAGPTPTSRADDVRASE